MSGFLAVHFVQHDEISRRSKLFPISYSLFTHASTVQSTSLFRERKFAHCCSPSLYFSLSPSLSQKFACAMKRLGAKATRRYVRVSRCCLKFTRSTCTHAHIRTYAHTYTHTHINTHVEIKIYLYKSDK